MNSIATQRAPRCFSCLWRSLVYDTPSLFSPVKIQVRGKKRKLPRSTTITVRLLSDVKAYGKKGTILAIAPARMRNLLYPAGHAAYMTAAEIKQANIDELVMERDASYGTVREAELGSVEKKAQLDMRTVTHRRAHELIEEIIPETLLFPRKPIASETGASSEGSSLIFGSVTSMDILANVTARLAQAAEARGPHEDAKRVVLSANDIKINVDGLSTNVAEGEKIKVLGEYSITITVKEGHPITRKVKVVPLEGES